jgi:hypothetical protein
VFEKKVVEGIETHFVFSTFFPENQAVCEIMWNNMVQPDTLWMRIK